MSRALIVTHPHENYDHGAIGEEAVIDYVEDFEGDTFVLPSMKSDRCERPYGDALIYDEVLEEEFYGELQESDVEFFEENYDEVVLAGGYVTECLRRTHESFEESDLSLAVEPEISYGQTFQNPEGFSLSEAISTKNEEVIEKFLGPLNDGRTKLT